MSIKFTPEVSVEDSLIFESIYPENLQWDLEGKQELKDDGVEFLYMIEEETGNLIGEAYYIPLDGMKNWPPDEEQAEDGLDDWYGKNCMYAFSTTILPEYQGKGYGKILKAYCLGMWKAQGYDYVLGHARDGASLKLQLFFGAKVIDNFHNWFGTNETYYLYKKQFFDQKNVKYCDICEEEHYFENGRMPQSHFKKRSKKGLSNSGRKPNK
jgi:GNAT superfamily N-acetyltransferase